MRKTMSTELDSSIFLFFKFRKSYNMQTLTAMISATHRRIQPIHNWAGLLIWIVFTLIGFDLFDLILASLVDCRCFD